MKHEAQRINYSGFFRLTYSLHRSLPCAPGELMIWLPGESMILCPR